MGRKKHAESRSNLKFRNKKIKENRLYGQYEKEKGMGDGDCDNKGKRKKSLWRWLSFFRWHFMFKRPKSFGLSKYDEKLLNKNKNFNGSKLVSCTSMDIIEIPTQPEQKISKILIKSSKNGLEAMVAQYDGRSLHPLKAKKFPTMYDLSKINKKRKQFTHQSTEKLEMTWNHNFRTINGERKEAPKNDNSLMSALYIRQDTDNVESTFFLEPKLSNECMEAKKLEENTVRRLYFGGVSYLACESSTDQLHFIKAYDHREKEHRQSHQIFRQLDADPFRTCSKVKIPESIAINSKHISCRIFDEVTDNATKTFKTLSEPTWNEKEKIFHQQRLQENLNELVEQFLLLQSDDLINFAAMQKRVKEENKRIRCDGDKSSFDWIEGSDKQILSRLSREREVSPEILVNIKPFKQHLSGEYIAQQFVKKRKRDVTDDKETKMMLKQKCRIEKKYGIQKTEDENLSYHCPVVGSKLQFSRTNNKLKVESSQMKTIVSGQSVEKEENKNENMSIYILDCDLLAASKKKSLEITPGDSKTKARFANTTDFCYVWGVYKSYASLETVDKKENYVQNKAIDEVLESFDDKDHDLIFKKNMAQFKRKISSKTFFFEKTVNLSTEVLGEAKVKEENISTKENECEMQERFILNLKEKKSLENQIFVKISASATLEKINYFNGYKLQKSLSTYSWFLLKQMEFCKIMASRIEVSTIKCPQASKEINSLLERNLKMVIEKKLPKVYREEPTILLKRSTKATGFNRDLQLLPNLKCNAKDCVEIAVRKNEFLTESMCGVLGETSRNQWQVTEIAPAFMCLKSLLNSMYCLKEVENYSFTNLEEPGVFKISKLILLEKSLEGTCSNLKTQTLYDQDGVNSFKNKGLTSYELPLTYIHKVMKIINDFTSQYHRKEYMSLRPFKSPAKNFSDTAILKRNDQTSVSCYIANTSLSDNKVSIPNKILITGSYENMLPIQTDEKCSVPVSFQFENIIHNFLLSESVEPRIIGKNHSSKEITNQLETKSLVNFELDGFRILYDALNQGSFTIDISPMFLSSEEKRILFAFSDFLMDQEIFLGNATESGKDSLSLSKLQEKPRHSLIEELSKFRVSKTIHKNKSIVLKYKSSSSFSKENILKAERNMQEHRMRRSLNFIKDVENFDFYNYKKKRGSTESRTDIRRTGSALSETPFTVKKKSFISSLGKDESAGVDIKLKGQLIQKELNALRGTQYKNGTSKHDLKLSGTKLFSKEQKMSSSCVVRNKKFFNTKNEKTKMFILEKNGVNIKKEIVAAFNSIKDVTPCKKEAEKGNKRMALVIMLSKNK